MRLIISIEVCTIEEIRFLRDGDYEFQIENVEKFMNKIKEYALFDEKEEYDLREYGLEFFHQEHDFKHTLNLLDRHDIKVLEKHSQQIN